MICFVNIIICIGAISQGNGNNSNAIDSNQAIIQLETRRATDMQKRCEALLRESGKNGALVLLNAQAGQVLALASNPPERYLAHTRGFPIGAMMHLITGTMALEEGMITPETIYDCPGMEHLAHGGRPYSCGGRHIHGPITMEEALVKSCHLFFVFNIGAHVQTETLESWIRCFGLGNPKSVDLPGETAGFVPSPESWAKFQADAEFPAPWAAGNNINLCIGQGELRVTPIQAVRIMAALINNSTLVTPFLDPTSAIAALHFRSHAVSHAIRPDTACKGMPCLQRGSHSRRATFGFPQHGNKRN